MSDTFQGGDPNLRPPFQPAPQVAAPAPDTVADDLPDLVPEVEPEHPREALRRIRATLAGNHTDVRDHLGVVTRALHDLIGLMHDALPAEHAMEDEDGEGH